MNESSTVIRIAHHARSWRGEISTHYDSIECGCRPDVLIEYTGSDGKRHIIRMGAAVKDNPPHSGREPSLL